MFTLYLVETICGGSHASGGGCGGPLGVMSTTEERFNQIANAEGPYAELIEHTDNESGFAREIAEAQFIYVKVRYRPCSGCYERC